MSAQVRGINSGSLIPAPNFLIAKDAEGKYTASRDFSALKGSSVTWAISKGTPISSLCTDLPPEFSFLQVDSFESRDAPGGITVVSVSFAGSPEDDEFGFDREITYSIRGTTFRRPITEHPTFIKDMEATDESIKRGLIGILTGDAYAPVTATSTSNYSIIRISPIEEIIGTGGWISNANNNAWWDIIVKKGLKDYDAASLEWTKSTSNAAGLTSADIAKLAKSDEPPGGPPTPEEPGWWQMVDLSDERSSNQSSNSVTWRYVYGVKIAKLHDYEEE